MDSRLTKLRYYVNSKISNLTNDENEFIEIELKYPCTNLFRITKLIWFLKACRSQKLRFKPTLMFIESCSPITSLEMVYYESINEYKEYKVINEDLFKLYYHEPM